MRLQLLSLAGVAVLLVVSLIDAPFPHDQRLQHVPTVVALGLLAWVAARERLSSAAFYGLLGFLVLHIIGARWVYSNVPYDRWAEAALGFRPSDRFGWERNHYDRVVHLAFGGLVMSAAAELFLRAGCRRSMALLGGLCLVTSASALYEIAEWQIGVWLAPEQAERYNGQQGDLWDAQKDMALALAGSVVTAAALAARGRSHNAARRF